MQVEYIPITLLPPVGLPAFTATPPPAARTASSTLPRLAVGASISPGVGAQVLPAGVQAPPTEMEVNPLPEDADETGGAPFKLPSEAELISMFSKKPPRPPPAPPLASSPTAATPIGAPAAVPGGAAAPVAQPAAAPSTNPLGAASPPSPPLPTSQALLQEEAAGLDAAEQAAAALGLGITPAHTRRSRSRSRSSPPPHPVRQTVARAATPQLQSAGVGQYPLKTGLADAGHGAPPDVGI